MRTKCIKIEKILFVSALTALCTIFLYGQSDHAYSKNVVSLVRGIGLTKEQEADAMKLIARFMDRIDSADKELTELIAPLAAGSKANPKAMDSLVALRKDFLARASKYHSEIEHIIGKTYTLRLIEECHKSIPRILIGDTVAGTGATIAPAPPKSTQTPAPTRVTITADREQGNEKSRVDKNAANATSDTASPAIIPKEVPLGGTDAIVASSSSAAARSATGLPIEVPLGSDLQRTGGGQSSSDLDLAIAGGSNSAGGSGNDMKGMDMMAMMNGMMGNMSPNGGSGSVDNSIDRGIIVQLLDANSSIVQLLAALRMQSPDSRAFADQLPPVYQILANQATLIGMLYSNYAKTGI